MTPPRATTPASRNQPVLFARACPACRKASRRINDYCGRRTRARTIGQRVIVLHASNERELYKTFATLARERVDALLVGGDTFFTSQPILFVVLTARHAIPTIYPWRSHVDAGV